MQFFPTFEFNFTTILFLCFAFIALLHLVFMFVIYGKLAFYKVKNYEPTKFPPISVIIAARNESDNLYEFLPYILNQDYPEFEVIVVNHQSIDDSSYILQALKVQYPQLRIIEVSKSRHLKPGKKLPLTLGIKGAKHEHLVFTDADCKPSSNQWLRSLAASFEDQNDIVIGYGPYNKEKGFLNKVIRFDTSWIAMNYFSFALRKVPYMGVGRNMAYTKSVFNRVSGFKNHYSLPSGDDDLFVQEAAPTSKININIDPKAFTHSDAHQSWNGWYRQKTRHYSTTNYYGVIKKWMLGFYPFSMLMLLLSFVILTFDSDFRWISLTIFALVILLKWYVQGKCFKKLNETSFKWFFPIWEIFYTLLMPIIYYTADKKQDNRW